MSKPEYKIEGRDSTIFRVKKSHDNPYVMVDRRPVDNPLLSFKSKGILTYLLSRPDGWEVNVPDLVNHSTDGPAAIRSGLKELREAGHIRYNQEREGGYIKRWVIEVYEVPEFVAQDDEGEKVLDCDFLQVGNLQVENQQVGNRGEVLSTLSNKELKQQKHGDLIDGMLAAAQMPGAKKALVKEYIFEQIKSRMGLNPSGKDAESFINYAADEHKKGRSFDVFLPWWLNKFPDPTFWSFRVMEQKYPLAFAQPAQPAQTILEHEDPLAMFYKQKGA